MSRNILTNLIKYVRSNPEYRKAESMDSAPSELIARHVVGEKFTFSEVIMNDKLTATFRCSNESMYYEGFGTREDAKKCKSCKDLSKKITPCKYLGDALVPFCGLKAADVWLYKKRSRDKLRMYPPSQSMPEGNQELVAYGIVSIKDLVRLL
ncbi:MAG: hypothetical protein WC916_05105 [Candidatus Woesearchaeota archaeon]